MRSTYGLLIVLFFLSACSGDSTETSELASSDINIKEEVSTSNLAIPDNRFSNTYQILIFGNSHTSGLSSLINALISTGNYFSKVNVVNAGGGYLDSELSYQNRVDLLDSKPWTHIILQGQKYSQSGSFIYPTASAKAWIGKAKSYQITPILFPEHPQKGNIKEGERVYLIHTGIAAVQSSCVAPVGLAWDKVILNLPQLALHNSDGNHASLIGKLLTAFIFYEVITGESADLLPFIEEINVEESTQQFLRQFASETIQANQPCIFNT